MVLMRVVLAEYAPWYLCAWNLRFHVAWNFCLRGTYVCKGLLFPLLALFIAIAIAIAIRMK